MRFLFVMDPVHTVRPASDTSFAWMLELQKRGFQIEHCLVSDLGLEQARAFAYARPAQASRASDPPLQLGEVSRVYLDDYAAVLIRKEPPFDDAYLWATQILELARSQTLVLNDPRGLREANEKLYTHFFADLMPPTIVTSDHTEIRSFVDAQGGQAVIKPLDGKGGEGVMVLRASDTNYRGIVELQTRLGKRLVMVQAFMPEIQSEGDKRVLVLDGQILGSMRRIPRADDIRSNLAIGARAEADTLTTHDRDIVAKLAPRFKADGLWFVGLDILAGKLIEVNVTSPTGIQAMGPILKRDLAAEIIDALLAKVKGS